ncbi:MAG: ATP-dependent Clp protease adapter ClpS [Acidobacteria bacterium]|nr:ATP-dependent Clp protease adapter ClpS [Acidobacteriota bacterium]
MVSQRAPDTQVVVKEKTETKKPKLYRVLLLNDDYTTMEFVVFVLETVFHKSIEEATALMWRIHQTGSGVCGVFAYEIAEMKVATVEAMARHHEFPLKCLMEEE